MKSIIVIQTNLFSELMEIISARLVFDKLKYASAILLSSGINICFSEDYRYIIQVLFNKLKLFFNNGIFIESVKYVNF